MGVSIGEKHKGSGIYYLFIRDRSLPGGRKTKRVPGEGQKAKELAEGIKLKLDARIALEEPLFDPESNLPTLTEHFQEFKRGYLKSLAPATQRLYKDAFRKYIEPRLGNLRLDHITRKRVKQFIDWLKCRTYIRKEKAKPLAKDTLRIIVSCLRSILNEAVEDETIQVNAASRPGKRFRELKQVHEIDPFREAEAQLFLETAAKVKPFYFPIFAAMLHTGMRIGECIGLKWPDVDFERRVLHVVKQGKEGGETKTRRTRQVEISDFLLMILRDLQSEREKEWGKQMPEFVFCSKNGTAMDVDNLRFQQFKKLLKTAKLRSIRLHDLRHTYATIHLQNGSPLQWVSRQLGHSSVKMTCDTYYHYLPDPGKQSYSNTMPAIGTYQLNNAIAFRK